MLGVIIFFSFNMVIFHTTDQIMSASNTTVNSTTETTIAGHMTRIIDIFKIIIVLFTIAFGILFLLAAGFDLKEFILGREEPYDFIRR